MLSSLRFGSTLASVIWIPALAVLASALVVAFSRRHGADRDSVRDRLACVWFVTAVGAAALLTLQTGSEGLGSNRPSVLNPVSTFSGRDAFANLLLYLPVGFFAALFWRTKPRPIVWASGFALAMSVIIEFAQGILPIDRAASTQDVVFNALGGLVGAVVATVVVRRLRSERDPASTPTR